MTLLDDRIHDALHTEAGLLPHPVPRLGLDRTQDRTLARGLLTAAAAAVIVLLIGAATVFAIRQGSSDDIKPADSPGNVTELAPGAFGPEPRFDTSALGEEAVREPAGLEALAAEGSLPDILGPESSRIVDEVMSGAEIIGDPVYVGHLVGFHAIVVNYVDATGEVKPCMLIVQGKTGVSHGCRVDPGVGPAERSPLAPTLKVSAIIPDVPGTELPEINISDLDENVSVVAIEFPAGERYWQRPIYGTVLFVPRKGTPRLGMTVTTYGADGNVLMSESF